MTRTLNDIVDQAVCEHCIKVLCGVALMSSDPIEDTVERFKKGFRKALAVGLALDRAVEDVMNE